MNYDEKVAFGISLVNWSIDSKELKIIDLNNREIDAVYIYEPIKGGKAILVTKEGKAFINSSNKSLDQLIEELKNGTASNFNVKKVKCPSCGNITLFDLTKIPALVKFDYKCSKCGFLHSVKLTADTNTFNQTKVEQAIEYFNKNIFTIENLKDPSWESICRKIGNQLVEKLINEGKSYHYILVQLHLNDNSKIEELLISNNIELPDSKNTKDSILSIINNKLKKVDEILNKNNNGMKW